jgi:hypothetical protein
VTYVHVPEASETVEELPALSVDQNGTPAPNPHVRSDVIVGMIERVEEVVSIFGKELRDIPCGHDEALL